MQLAAPATNPLLEGLEVFGMPLFANKVVVIDPKPTDPTTIQVWVQCVPLSITLAHRLILRPKPPIRVFRA